MIIPSLSGVIGTSKESAETKAQATKLWSQGTQLNRAGKQGEAWRSLEHARALATGQPWTAKEEFAQSLTLRADAPVADPSRPFYVRLSQRYAQAHPISNGLKLKLALIEPNTERKVVKDLGTIEGVRLDLIEKPFGFSLDLHGMPAGRYHLMAQVADGENPLGRLEAALWLVPGLDKQEADVRQRLSKVKGNEGTKARILYPFDLARVVNLAGRDAAIFDYGAEIKRSFELLNALSKGKDLLYQARGDLKKAYWLEEAGEVMPYRVYVPKKWKSGTQLPMVVYLHGAGSDENSAFEWPYERAAAKLIDGKLAQIAEERGFIAVAPLGFRTNGNWGGNGIFQNQAAPNPQAGQVQPVLDPFDQRVYAMAEKDTLNVTDRVAKEYGADPKRFYLIGNSAGGGGALYLGAKYRERWAALAPSALPYHALSFNYESFKGMPVLFSHGVNDPVAWVKNSREAAAFMKEKGVDAALNEVSGVETAVAHNAAWFAALPQIFDFLAKHRKD